LVISKTFRTLASVSLAASLLMLVGCAQLKAGIITDKEHIPAYSYETWECVKHDLVKKTKYDYEEDVWIFSEEYECIQHGFVTHQVPDRYTLTIAGKIDKDSDKTSATYPVSQVIYERAEIGYHFNSETKEISPR
jgi:hypothetical protein